MQAVGEDGGRLGDVADLNTAFHAAVADLAGNAYLSLVVGPMLRRAQWLFQQTAKHRAPHSWTEHLSLYEAIAEGDEREAEARAVTHVEAARRSYLAALADTDGVLIFLDADVRLAPGALAAAAHELRSARADLVCPWPRQRAESSVADLA